MFLRLRNRPWGGRPAGVGGKRVVVGVSDGGPGGVSEGGCDSVDGVTGPVVVVGVFTGGVVVVSAGGGVSCPGGWKILSAVHRTRS